MTEPNLAVWRDESQSSIRFSGTICHHDLVGLRLDPAEQFMVLNALSGQGLAEDMLLAFEVIYRRLKEQRSKQQETTDGK